MNTLLASMVVILALAMASSATAQAPVNYADNLAKVPAADPAVTDAPALLKHLNGVRPRLLFTAEEIVALKAQAEKDEILKKTIDGLVTWGRRFRAPQERPLAIVTNDTPALAGAFGQYAGLAYAYALDKNDATKQGIIGLLTAMLETPHWADTAELDSNMGTGNNMIMVALLFDAIYNDLEPDFRRKMAEKILTHVRRMYYLGYKQLSLMPIKYWQQDPQNNHRWHRGAGMAACLAAIADIEGVDSAFMRQEIKKEIDFLLRWYPADGDCHEGSTYQVFGFTYLAMAAKIMDRNFGTEYLKHPGFANAWAQHVYYLAPGRKGYMSFGDAPNSEGVFGHLDAAYFLSPSLSRDKNVQAALLRDFRARSGNRYPWTLLTWYDPTVGEGDADALPKSRLFADLGAATMRDAWAANGVMLSFKCGPYGGYRLNEYRHAVPGPDGQPHYVNLAHDDPDANSFALGMDGEFFFHPGTYCTKKMTESSNTITVDGKGQHGEGDAYTQPVRGVDMRTLSYLTGWKVGEEGRIIVEGEAGNAYPTLKHFRRTAVWMPGQYILLLDHIGANEKRQIMWRGLAQKAQFDKPEEGRCYSYTRSGKRVDFQMLANQPFNGAIDFHMLLGRWGHELLHQFQFSVESPSVKFACLLDPWKKNVGMALKEEGGVVTLTVKGEGIDDVWRWQQAKDMDTPSVITGARGKLTLIELTEKDVAPKGDKH